MAKSKAQLRLEFLEIGGDASLIPENLDDIKADEIEKLIESQKLQKQLQASEKGAGEGGSTGEGQPSTEAPKAQEAPKAEAPAGVKFTLVKAARWGTARIPDKNYNAGVSYYISDEIEAEVLRASGMFKEGDE